MLKDAEESANPQKDGLFRYVMVIIDVKALPTRDLNTIFDTTVCKFIR